MQSPQTRQPYAPASRLADVRDTLRDMLLLLWQGREAELEPLLESVIVQIEGHPNAVARLRSAASLPTITTRQ